MSEKLDIVGIGNAMVDAIIPSNKEEVEKNKLNRDSMNLIDEDLKNYMEIQNWIRGLGFPESLSEFAELEDDAEMPSNFGNNAGHDIYSDGTLQILSSNLVPKFQVAFNDLFPYSLSTVTFDATDTDIEYFTADVSFKYTIYTITDLENNPL